MGSRCPVLFVNTVCIVVTTPRNIPSTYLDLKEQKPYLIIPHITWKKAKVATVHHNMTPTKCLSCPNTPTSSLCILSSWRLDWRHTKTNFPCVAYCASNRVRWCALNRVKSRLQIGEWQVKLAWGVPFGWHVGLLAFNVIKKAFWVLDEILDR